MSLQDRNVKVDWKVALRAAAGDREDLRRCVAHPEGFRLRGLGPALALQARAAGLSAHRTWRNELRASATNWLLLDGEAQSLGQRLRRASIDFVTLKGLSVAPDYAALLPESQDSALARPTSDIDLLVRREQRLGACQLLENEGWRPLFDGPRAERYLDEEGYAWQARSADGALLELHHDLWNSVPSSLAELSLDGAETPSGPLPRPRPALRFVIAAVHGLLEPRPRRALDLLDLEAIRRSSGPELVAEVVDCCRETGLQLPVAIAAGLASAAFEAEAFRELNQLLLGECRGPERTLRSVDLDDSGSRHVTLLRLLSGRPTRLGARALWRSVWPHPGIVERDTPESLPWWRRRLRRQLRPFLLTEKRA